MDGYRIITSDDDVEKNENKSSPPEKSSDGQNSCSSDTVTVDPLPKISPPKLMDSSVQCNECKNPVHMFLTKEEAQELFLCTVCYENGHTLPGVDYKDVIPSGVTAIVNEKNKPLHDMLFKYHFNTTIDDTMFYLLTDDVNKEHIVDKKNLMERIREAGNLNSDDNTSEEKF